jgi:hypothetical protein
VSVTYGLTPVPPPWDWDAAGVEGLGSGVTAGPGEGEVVGLALFDGRAEAPAVRA